MSSLNITFLEEYKHLDKIIKEVFGTEKGISDYINIATTTYNLQYNNDIKTLKHLRYIRNRLTHDTDTLNTQMCTQADIDWLKGFYQKVYSVSDPLSLRLKPQTTTKNIVNINIQNKENVPVQDDERTSPIPVFLGIALAIITVILIYFLFF